MEVPFALSVHRDGSLMFGVTLQPGSRMLPALLVFFIVMSLATVRPAAVAKESHDPCGGIQAFRGVQDARALPGKLFFYPISPFAFHGTITHHQVTLANGSSLPKWLEYNPDTNTLQGLPVLEENGEYHLTVAAHGEACGPNTPAATTSFTLHVVNYITACEKRTSTDQKPMNDNPLGTKTAFPVTWQITSQLLEDPSITSLQAELHATSVFLGVQGKSILPLTPSEESFCGTGAMHTPWLPASLVIPTGQPNTSPRVVNAINWITATIGHKFTFSVPPDTFYDQEDGDTSQLTLGMNPADGSPVGPGNWLHFNSRFQTMRGYPLADDFQYSPQEFLLFATDSEGLKTSDVLTIELLRPTIIPCHHYTIRTKNSYHSFLRERERVYLFLEKLSKYLSSGSPSSMILLGLRPGSTLITWFDNSFCARNNRCSRDEIQGVLLKLRLPSGNVHPDFADAMLPEYNIYHAEDVTYGGTCSSNKSLISNQTISSFKDCHSWTRKSLFALIISMCAAVMIILMMTFWYCKYKKKINGSQSMSFHRKPFVSYADLEMDALKSQKAAILEQEYPWPAELWLPVPTPTQQHPCRSSANLAASMLPPPPKYRLPPLYGTNKPSHTYDNPNRLKSSSKARLY
ncbi:uncharacterized protein LOC143839051 isoform X2 [Paroedura picta]|uniref:uncharacterized protein LOC143839051 isoform X2 n=1 Tax=Paroedura picta TaxID=143630 RepID=UPI0040573B50